MSIFFFLSSFFFLVIYFYVCTTRCALKHLDGYCTWICYNLYVILCPVNRKRQVFPLVKTKRTDQEVLVNQVAGSHRRQHRRHLKLVNATLNKLTFMKMRKKKRKKMRMMNTYCHSEFKGTFNWNFQFNSSSNVNVNGR